eukprot:53694-Eustigmatos_ZCMA.PRE.1
MCCNHGADSCGVDDRVLMRGVARSDGVAVGGALVALEVPMGLENAAGRVDIGGSNCDGKRSLMRRR